MNTFFTELAKSMNEGQIIDIKVEKKGEELLFIITTKLRKSNKTLTANGSPEDADVELLNLITAILERKKGLMTTLTEEDDNSNDDEKEISKPKKEASKPAKKAAEKSNEPVTTENVDGPKELPTANAPEENEPKMSQPKIEKTKSDSEFKELMATGKRLLSESKYQLAVETFQLALAIKPGDREAIDESNKAYKWVKAVAAL
jgi:hypothetical protein